MKDLEQLETTYSTRSFIIYLQEGCATQRSLERKKKELKSEVGQESYDGQVQLLETGLNRYLHQISKRVKAMDKHIHRIHPERFSLFNAD